MENEFNFKPFDKVLVRDSHIEHWEISFYSRYIGENHEFPHKCTGSCYKYCIPYNNETAHLLGTTEAYVEPWTPKDGDFVFCEGIGGEKIAICKSIRDFMIYRYASFNKEYNKLMTSKGDHFTFEKIRPATDSEKKQLLDALHKEGKDWNAEKKKIVEYKWRPKEKEYYWTIYGDGSIDRICKATESDAMHIKIGNCFRTKEEAQAMADKVKELFKRK